MTINSIKLYIYILIILYFLLYIFKCIHAYVWGYMQVYTTISDFLAIMGVREY